MSRRKVTELTCDRCGTSELLEHKDGRAEDWGRMIVGNIAGKGIIGTVEVPVDICPGCVDDIVKFYTGEKK